MTVAMLMKNTIIAAKKVLRLEEQEVLKPKERGVATNQTACLLCREQCTLGQFRGKTGRQKCSMFIYSTDVVLYDALYLLKA